MSCRNINRNKSELKVRSLQQRRGRKIDRSQLKVQGAERMVRVRKSAALTGLQIGTRLRKIVGDGIFEKWRWGRVPMVGGGWLVTYQHDPSDSDEEGRDDREVRLAVMHSQFGWGAYAVCECKSGDRLGWYDGEPITAAEFEQLGRMEGREHTVRVSTTDSLPYVNGIDGVAGMQYLNSEYGRVAREQATGQPEHPEKTKFKINKKRVIVVVKEKHNLEPGDEIRVAYGWTKAAWFNVLHRGGVRETGEREGGVRGGEVRRGWKTGDSR